MKQTWRPTYQREYSFLFKSVFVIGILVLLIHLSGCATNKKLTQENVINQTSIKDIKMPEPNQNVNNYTLMQCARANRNISFDFSKTNCKTYCTNQSFLEFCSRAWS